MVQYLTQAFAARKGISNQIMVIERQAYGFRDDDCFILKIEGAFPGELQLNPR